MPKPAAPKIQHLKIFGERNTGTRAIIRMLRDSATNKLKTDLGPVAANTDHITVLRAQVDGFEKSTWRKIYRDALLDMEVELGGPTKTWKHALPIWDEEFVRRQVHIVFSVRDPYSWFLALARRPYHRRGIQARSLEEFATHPWMTVGRDNMDRVVPSPISLWNGKVAAYAPFRQQADAAGLKTAMVRFEDFVVHSDVVIAEVLDAFGEPYDDVKRIEVSTKEDTRPLSDISAYYRDEQWKSWLTRDLVASLNDLIDWDVAQPHGYTQLDPNEFPEKLSLKQAVNLAEEIPWLGKRTEALD